MNADGEGSDEAVDGAVRRGLVAGVVGDRAEDVSTQSLDTCLRSAPSCLVTGAGSAGGGAGYGEPVRGAGGVPHHGHAWSLGRGDGEAVILVPVTRSVADPTESSLMSHTDGVLLVRQLETLILLYNQDMI